MACKRSCLIAEISLRVPPSRGRSTATGWQGWKVRGTAAKSGKSLPRLARRPALPRLYHHHRHSTITTTSSTSFSSSSSPLANSNCPDPFPVERKRLGPLVTQSAAASIIPNYNNKCKSGITTREPGNKVSPGISSSLLKRRVFLQMRCLVQKPCVRRTIPRRMNKQQIYRVEI